MSQISAHGELPRHRIIRATLVKCDSLPDGRCNMTMGDNVKVTKDTVVGLHSAEHAHPTRDRERQREKLYPEDGERTTQKD
jgi:hypothetical protein